MLREFKAGKYTFHKGAKYMISFTQFFFDEKYYTNAKSFQMGRFSKKEESKDRVSPAINMPFSLGKRSCIGRYLGELFVQIGVVSMAKQFEFKPLVGLENSAVLALTYAPGQVYLRIKPRQ